MPKDNKYSFRASEQLAQVLGEYKECVNWSEIINRDLVLLDHVLAMSVPVFSKEKWLALFDAYNGHLYSEAREYTSAARIAEQVADFHQYSENLVHKYGIDLNNFLDALSDLTPAQCAAVHYVIDKFWHSTALQCENWNELPDKINGLRGRFWVKGASNENL